MPEACHIAGNNGTNNIAQIANLRPMGTERAMVSMDKLNRGDKQSLEWRHSMFDIGKTRTRMVVTIFIISSRR